MSQLCQDRDLLIVEPGLFTSGALRAQRLAGGTDGALVGATFTSASADFSAAGVSPGMVLCVHPGQVSEGACYEILDAPDAHTLSVSVVRADLASPAVAPPDGGDSLAWHVLTFAPQIAGASGALSERLRTMAEAAGIQAGTFVESAQLCRVAAYAALAGIYAAAAESADESDARWTKHRYYADMHRSNLLTLRLALDVDGDGRAERTRTLGNVLLRRR